MRLRPLRQQAISHTKFFHTTIQLWGKVPNQHESFNVTTDAPHNQPHTGKAEEGRLRFEYRDSSSKIDPETASNMILDFSDRSAMETPASSFLVFGDRKSSHLIRIPRKQYLGCLMLPCLIEQS